MDPALVIIKLQEGHGGPGRSPEKKTAPPPGSHVFRQTRTIFKLIQDIVRKNVLTKFHEDWTINVTSRVLTRFYYTLKPYKVNCHAPWRPYIIGTHVLTKFHEDWTKNVTSRVLTRKPPRPLAAIFFNQPEPFSNSVLTRFYNSHLRKTAPPPGGDVFHPTGTIFEHVQDFIGTHVPTKFNADWTKNVTSRVLTMKTATPPGSHVFQPTGTILELVQDIIETHVLTKFHEDWTINVTLPEHSKVN
ncbi:hypothetical protein DPMN_054720 [Dreissena polymorpha]|uniref:Uncharacterized protein n=1 Tax=Dreissena polymorpha TaxID=45954 RepID=A0A9D4CQ72_DREPO|nr:hypothetical protein DPMN_054720 [Dreissena polymorpha]